MSIKYLAYAFDARVNNPLRKLVLLKLCDNANDSGECWPSFQHIADQCEISRRSAINHIQALIDCGFLVSEARFKSGEQTTNMYKINKDALLGGSAGAAPPSESPAPPPVQELHPPSAGAAPRTVIEPSNRTVKESKPSAGKLDYSVWGDFIDQQLLNDWLIVRKTKRAAVTQTVLDTTALEFKKASGFGYTVNDCLRCWVSAGWQGFKFEWMQNQIAKGNNYGANKQTNQQRGLDPDDTSWADRVFGAGSSAGDSVVESGIQIIEGDFSSLGSGNT